MACFVLFYAACVQLQLKHAGFGNFQVYTKRRAGFWDCLIFFFFFGGGGGDSLSCFCVNILSSMHSSTANTVSFCLSL